MCIYTLLSQSLSLSAGFGGMMSLAHAGFYGIGAYTAAILSISFQLPFLIVLFIAMFICGLVALLVSTIALRTVDDYFIVCTLGIQIIIYSLMINWMSVTRGPMGLPGIPPIQLLGTEIGLGNRFGFLMLSFFFVVLTFFILKKVTLSSFGLTLRALSEDEIFTQSLGKNVYISKVIAFTISAMIASIPGVLYAHYVSFIDPTSFTIDESIFILSIVIIGGFRNLWSIFIAASFLVILPEALRFIGMPSSIAANMRQVIYGAVLIYVIFRRVYSSKVKVIT
jgi:branched-chain amino acid transport system permease protein